MTYSKELAESIAAFFREDDWKVQFDEEDGVFRGGLSGLKGKIKDVGFLLYVRESSFLICHVLNLSATEDVREAMCEFITRANYGMINGCFEMDMADGEIRFRHAVSINDVRVNRDETMRFAMLLGANMISRFGDGLVNVLFDLKTPEEAIAAIEK